MIDPKVVSMIANNTAQALGLLAAAGLIAGIVRWRYAVRRDLLFSFIVFLLGTFVAQLPVHIGGMVGWGSALILLATAGRLIQLLGSILFLRASLRDHCPWWGWMAVVVFVSLVMAVV
jgi:hypothetical protein